MWIQLKRHRFLVSLMLITLCLTACFKPVISALSPNATAFLVARRSGAERGVTSQPWSNVAIGGMGFVTGLVIHPTEPNLVYARTDVGGVFRWNESTSSWAALMDKFGKSQANYHGVESVALDPGDTNVVYAAVGGGTNQTDSDVLKSTDRGQNWTPTGLKAPSGLNVRIAGNDYWRWIGERLAVDPNNSNIVYFGSRLDGLYRSTNGAASWSKVASFPTAGTLGGISFVLFDQKSGSNNSPSQNIYVGVMGSGVYQSSNAGVTWKLLAGGPGVALNPQQAVLASNGTLYVTYFTTEAAPGGGMWKYAQGKWTDITPTTGRNYTALTVDPTNPDVVMVTEYPLNPSGIYRSVDGGKSWSQVKLNVTTVDWWPNWHLYTPPGALVIDPNNRKRVWLTNGFGVLRTDDITVDSSAWTTIMTGFEELVVLVLKSPPVANGAPLFSGVADMDGFRHDSLTTVPHTKFDGIKFGDTTGMDFCESNPNIIVRVGSFPGPNGREASLFQGGYSTDNGLNWTTFANPPAGAANGKIAVGSQLQANGYPILMWTPQGDLYPYRSLDGGKSWTPVKGAPNNTTGSLFSHSQPIASDRVDGNKFYLYKSGVPGLGGAFYRSTDGGGTWTTTVGHLPDWYDHYVKAAPGMNGEVWLGLESGNQLYRSSDSGSSFTVLANVQRADNFAFGKAAPGSNKPTVFVYGVVNNTEGLFRSDDATSLPGDAKGATWVKISTTSQAMGSVTYLEGDGLVFGRVYVGTGGRGILYGQPAGTPTSAAN